MDSKQNLPYQNRLRNNYMLQRERKLPTSEIGLESESNTMKSLCHYKQHQNYIDNAQSQTNKTKGHSRFQSVQFQNDIDSRSKTSASFNHSSQLQDMTRKDENNLEVFDSLFPRTNTKGSMHTQITKYFSNTNCPTIPLQQREDVPPKNRLSNIHKNIQLKPYQRQQTQEILCNLQKGKSVENNMRSELNDDFLKTRESFDIKDENDENVCMRQSNSMKSEIKTFRNISQDSQKEINLITKDNKTCLQERSNFDKDGQPLYHSKSNNYYYIKQPVRGKLISNNSKKDFSTFIRGKGNRSQEINTPSSNMRKSQHLSQMNSIILESGNTNTSSFNGRVQATFNFYDKSQQKNVRDFSVDQNIAPLIDKNQICGRSQHVNESNCMNEQNVQCSSTHLVNVGEMKRLQTAGNIKRDRDQPTIRTEAFRKREQAAMKIIQGKINRITTMLPLDLVSIVEKPFKQNILILKNGLKNPRGTGPKVSATEYELLTLFHRLIEKHTFAMKGLEDNFQKHQSIYNQLQERVILKINDILVAIKHIQKIKGGEVKAVRLFSSFFEGYNHLKFIFFNTEETPQSLSKQSQYEQSKSDLGVKEPLPNLLALTLTSVQLKDRLFHQNFVKFFHPRDFEILIEYVILPDIDIIRERAEGQVNRFFQKSLETISEGVEVTAQKIFDIEQEYLFSKRNPRRIGEMFSIEAPSFLRNALKCNNPFFEKLNKFDSKANMLFKKSQAPFQLHGQMDLLVQDLSKHLKKYQILSPFSSEMDPILKSHLVKMYNTKQKEL